MLVQHQWPVTTALRHSSNLQEARRTTDLDTVLQRLQDGLKCDYVAAAQNGADGKLEVFSWLGDDHQIGPAGYTARFPQVGWSHASCAYRAQAQIPVRLAAEPLGIAPACAAEVGSNMLSLVVPRNGSTFITLIAVRHLPRPPFTVNDEGTLQRDAEWVADYVAIWRRLRDSEQRRTGLQRTLDQVGIAIITLDRDGRTLEANPAAQALLRAGDGLIAVGEKLSAAVLEDAVRLHSAIGHTLGGPLHGARAPVLTIRRKRRRPLVVAVLRVAADPVPGETAIVLQIVEPDRDHDSAITAACTLFGFTGAETRLAKLLVGGATLAGAAAALRIQMPTARTYLKQAFAKSGTNRQAALVQVLLSGLVHTNADTVLTAM